MLDFQCTLSLLRQIVSAGSAGVGKLLAQAQPAQTFFQCRLSMRSQLLAQAQCVRKFIPCFLSAHSACVGNFERSLSLHRQFFSPGSACAKKMRKMANICRSLKKKIIQYSSHLSIQDLLVKKNGSKISHLGTFKGTQD